MFGNILIDKFRVYIPLDEIRQDLAIKLRTSIGELLSKHFANNAYSVKLTKGQSRLTFEFNPTRYYSNIANLDTYTDTNIDMPLEEEFYEFLNELCKIIIQVDTYNEAKITKLHLAKNILLKQNVSKYINFLSQMTYKYPYRALSHYSTDTRTSTLCLTSLAKNLENSDKTGDREIIIYNKTLELSNKGITEIYLKKPLENEEIKSCNSFYDSTINRLDLRFLNILRMEMQYESSQKLKEISKFLNFNSVDKGLLLCDFMNLADSANLYNALNNFYTDKLRTVLFNITKKEESELNVYQKILADNWDKTMELAIMNVYIDTGLWNKYQEKRSKIQNKINNGFITELKCKLNI